MTELNFDLNIDNYKLSELKKMLDLELPYTIEDIDERYEKLKTKLIKDNSLDEIKRTEILDFVNKIQEILRLDLEVYLSNMKNGRSYTNDSSYILKNMNVSLDFVELYNCLNDKLFVNIESIMISVKNLNEKLEKIEDRVRKIEKNNEKK